MNKIKTAFNEQIKPGSILYVSGPMSGYPNNNVERFNFVCSVLREKLKDVEVINPAEIPQKMLCQIHFSENSPDIRDPPVVPQIHRCRLF